jgi:hypothetical protein
MKTISFAKAPSAASASEKASRAAVVFKPRMLA